MTMSLTPAVKQRLPENYTGTTKYWKAFEDWFGVTLTQEQRQIAEALALNQYLHVEGANGFGKTFGTVAIALAFWARHYPSSVVITSGTYGKLKRTFCSDAEKLHQDSPLFGRWKWSPNPHIDVDGEPTWQFEVMSPEDHGELEGIHNDYTLVIVDEADKKDIDLATLDSLDSLISDKNDRMLILSNPPEDESNSLENLDEIGLNPVKMQFSTFESHNVLVELGEREGDMIPGLATLDRLQKKWESHNSTSWPGFTEAKNMSDPNHEAFREDLSTIWYRRFAGVKPPSGAAKLRPFYLTQVDKAFDEHVTTTNTRQATGIDVARSSDKTVMISERENVLTVDYSKPGTNHTVQFNAMWEILDKSPTKPITVDAIGEGSGKADDTSNLYPSVHRFKSSEDAFQSDTYKDCWTEALCEFGKWMKRGGTFSDTTLRQELQIAARTIELEEKFYQSRSDNVYKASSKDKVKEVLGRSPDHLDAAIMAVWAKQVPVFRSLKRRTPPSAGKST